MNRTIIAATILALTTGVVDAQASETVVDHVAHTASGPDGTVGAMQTVVRGLATSPEDVVAQQEGRSTAADGARPLEFRPATAAAGAASGTVGATPGSDRPH